MTELKSWSFGRHNVFSVQLCKAAETIITHYILLIFELSEHLFLFHHCLYIILCSRSKKGEQREHSLHSGSPRETPWASTRSWDLSLELDSADRTNKLQQCHAVSLHSNAGFFSMGSYSCPLRAVLRTRGSVLPHRHLQTVCLKDTEIS